MAYLWIGLNEVAAVIAVAVNKTAMVAVMIREGVRSVDPSLAELARAYRSPPRRRLWHIWLPQIWPFLAASMRNGMAIIWKIVLVVEFLGRSNGVGFHIHLYFQHFETGYVLAYALSFVAVMLAIEYTLLVPIERRAVEWRQRTRAFAKATRSGASTSTASIHASIHAVPDLEHKAMAGPSAAPMPHSHVDAEACEPTLHERRFASSVRSVANAIRRMNKDWADPELALRVPKDALLLRQSPLAATLASRGGDIESRPV